MKCIPLAIAIALLYPAHGAAQQNSLTPLLEQGQNRQQINVESQQGIDQLAQARQEVVAQRQQSERELEGLNIYNELMQRQIQTQNTEMVRLEQSIAEVAVIERQIVPLLMRMLDSLEQFIELDIPFLLEERRSRVSGLRDLIERADVTASEKARRVFEAYQIENDYGRTIEAYRGKLELENGSFDVDYLRVGRVALMYQQLGSTGLGYYNPKLKRFDTLPPGDYQRALKQSLQVARQEVAPALIQVPLALTEIAQ